MWPQPYEGRNKSFEKGRRPLPGSEFDQIQRSLEFARLGIHRTRLEHVQGLRQNCGYGALKNKKISYIEFRSGLQLELAISRNKEMILLPQQTKRK